MTYSIAQQRQAIEHLVSLYSKLNDRDVNTLVNAAKQGNDLIIYGEGNQVRSFCHINDAVETLLKLENINGEIFNVGNNMPVTIKCLAERVLALSKSTSQLKFIPTPHSDISNRVPDLTKLKYMTGFVATYDLDSIIQDML
jgi:nucleoside-diphosphate-sugar epimerase